MPKLKCCLFNRRLYQQHRPISDLPMLFWAAHTLMTQAEHFSQATCSTRCGLAYHLLSESGR